MPSSDSIPYNLLNSNDELGMVYSRNFDSNSIKYLYPGCFVCSGLFFIFSQVIIEFRQLQNCFFF